MGAGDSMHLLDGHQPISRPPLWVEGQGPSRPGSFLEPVTCVMETNRADTLALSAGSGIALWKPGSDAPHTPLFALPGWPSVRCNDAAVDPGGALWVGRRATTWQRTAPLRKAAGWTEYSTAWTAKAPRHRNGAAIWALQTRCFGVRIDRGSISAIRCRTASGLTIMTWQAGSIRAEQPFFQGFERGLPDGSAIDTEGYVWNCRYGGGCIVRVAPDGKIDRVIEMPVSRPTNCTFGGPGGNVLYVTSAGPQAGHWERFGGRLFFRPRDQRDWHGRKQISATLTPSASRI